MSRTEAIERIDELLGAVETLSEGRDVPPSETEAIRATIVDIVDRYMAALPRRGDKPQSP